MRYETKIHSTRFDAENNAMYGKVFFKITEKIVTVFYGFL